jgi:hypothetical protein
MGYKAQRRRCTAVAKSTGRPCQAYACVDAFVCQKHGGMAPQVQNKALERRDEIQVDALEAMRALIPEAVAALQQIINNPEAKDADRLKAADAILDRFVAKKLQVEDSNNQEELDLDADLAPYMDIDIEDLG